MSIIKELFNRILPRKVSGSYVLLVMIVLFISNHFYDVGSKIKYLLSLINGNSIKMLTIVAEVIYNSLFTTICFLMIITFIGSIVYYIIQTRIENMSKKTDEFSMKLYFTNNSLSNCLLDLIQWYFAIILFSYILNVDEVIKRVNNYINMADFCSVFMCMFHLLMAYLIICEFHEVFVNIPYNKVQNEINKLNALNRDSLNTVQK